MAHQWPNENTKWPTLEETHCLILALYDLVLQLKCCMIGPSLLIVAQLTCNFWASLVLNKNSYQQHWYFSLCQLCILVFLEATGICLWELKNYNTLIFYRTFSLISFVLFTNDHYHREYNAVCSNSVN